MTEDGKTREQEDNRGRELKWGLRRSHADRDGSLSCGEDLTRGGQTGEYKYQPCTTKAISNDKN